MRRQHFWPSVLTLPLLFASVFRTSYSNTHFRMCVGEAIIVADDGDQVTIGSGAQRAFNTSGNSPLLESIIHSKPACFKDSVKHKLTVNIIKYPSEDLTDPSDNVLFGWLHVHVTKADNSKGIDLLVMQPSAPLPLDLAYVPGSFVSTDFKKGCKESLGDGPDLTAKQVLAPCFYVPDPSTSVPNAIAYARNPELKEKTTIREARFNFRTDFPDCGRLSEESHLEFRAYATTDQTTEICDNGTLPFYPLQQKKIFVNNLVFGGYDPEPPKGHPGVTCNEELTSSNTKWVHQHDGEIEYPPVEVNPDCYKQSAWRDVGTSYGKMYDRFVGRCSKAGNQPWGVTEKSPYDCFITHPGVEPLKPWKPPFYKGGENCTTVQLKCEAEANFTKKYGISANSKIGKYVWGYRVTHGMAMSFSAMFIIPTGTLLARYFKESYMPFRFINVHIWHGFHISSALTGFSGLLSGLIAAVIGRLYFGFSWHGLAYFHVGCGYVSLVLYVTSIATAPIRLYVMMPRKLTICAHFILGSLARVLFTICLLTSFYIAGSPAGKYDINMQKRFEADIVIVVAWIVVDVAVHLFLQCQLWDFQSIWPRRYAFGVPIPIVRASFAQDAPNMAVRNLLLLSHVVFSLVCAVRLSVLMCGRVPEGRRFGKMGYTHKPSGKLNELFEGASYNDGDGDFT